MLTTDRITSSIITTENKTRKAINIQTKNSYPKDESHHPPFFCGRQNFLAKLLSLSILVNLTFSDHPSLESRATTTAEAQN